MSKKEQAMADFYKGLHKSDLIRAIKQYLKENKMVRNRRDGFRKDAGNGLERPIINKETYSWNAFSKLPKDVIIVYAFMKGCDIKYLDHLKATGFFNKREIREKLIANARKNGARTYVEPSGKLVIKPVGWKAINER
tara:strand:- start:367 stop:777 length:411 start_codon:yes stop_codon:yes gene_type:complete